MTVEQILCDKSFHYVASIKYKFPFADLQKKTSEGEIVTRQDVWDSKGIKSWILDVL